MRRIAYPVSILTVLCVLAGGCGAPAPRPDEDFFYEERAIKLTIKADSRLNLAMDKAHSLVLSVLQLKDEESFNNLRQSPEGLTKLIENPEDDPNILRWKKIVVQPGDFKTLYVDRAEGARSVGFVAGYYHLEPGKVERVFEIPTMKARAGGMLFNRSQKLVPRPDLSVGLLLGPQQILQAKTAYGH